MISASLPALPPSSVGSARLRTRILWAASPLEHRRRGCGTCQRCTLQALITEPGQVGFYRWAVLIAHVPSLLCWKQDIRARDTFLPSYPLFYSPFQESFVIMRLSQGHAGWARKCYARRDVCGITHISGRTWHSKPGKCWRNKQLPWWPGAAVWQGSEDMRMSVFPGPAFKNANDDFKRCLPRQNKAAFTWVTGLTQHQ